MSHKVTDENGVWVRGTRLYNVGNEVSDAVYDELVAANPDLKFAFDKAAPRKRAAKKAEADTNPEYTAD